MDKRKSLKLIENVHYYIENGMWVFTEQYHLEKGRCCRNNCRHCPYKPIKKNNMTNETYQDSEPVYKVDSEDHLHNWVFHYNPHVSLWSAIPRDKYLQYWSDYQIPGVFKSPRVSVLVEIIQKTNGDPEKIEYLLGNE
jgi:hypothetical protein